jgi:16S rRNA (uracil1498-N3)-methyltransferase
MPPRFHVPLPLQTGAELALPAGAARHAQVLRLQPGAPVTLFDGSGGEWSARVLRMGRSDVQVELENFHAIERELPMAVTLAVGMPANERMDTLVEKATELGVAAIQPLLCERSVLRLSGERAQKKVAHWQAVALAACEQSGRTRVPQVAPVQALLEWLDRLPPLADAPRPGARWLLSLRDAMPAREALAAQPGALTSLTTLTSATSLSGPEGGFTETEEFAARRCGFVPLTLGPRTLRADTAPLALLAHLALAAPNRSPE